MSSSTSDGLRGGNPLGWEEGDLRFVRLWSVTGGMCDVVRPLWVWVELNGIVGIYDGEISSQSELSDFAEIQRWKDDMVEACGSYEASKVDPPSGTPMG